MNKIIQKILGKFGCNSDTLPTPREALLAYQNEPMTYNIIIMDVLEIPPVTGIDSFSQIREFEQANGIPQCFLIASDSTRSMMTARNGLRQRVVDSGVDYVLPWNLGLLSLYDALAVVPERATWNRPEVVTSVSTAEGTVDVETSRSDENAKASEGHLMSP